MNKIKKFSSLLLCSAMALSLGLTAFAAATNSNATKNYDVISEEDIMQIKEETQEILDYANSYYTIEKIDEELFEEDIDFDELTKMYVVEDTLSYSDEVNLDDKDYILTLPIQSGSKTVEIIFNKIKPLTDEAKERLSQEAIKELESYEGKFKVSGAILHDNKMSYKENTESIFEQNNIDPNEYSVVNITAMPGVNAPMTLLIKNDTIKKAFINDSIQNINARTSNDSNTVYDFSYIMDVSQDFLENN